MRRPDLVSPISSCWGANLSHLCLRLQLRFRCDRWSRLRIRMIKTTLILSDIWSRVGDMSHGRSSHGCTSYSSPEPGYENSILPKEIPVTHSLNLKHFFGTLERNVYSSLNNDAPKKGGSVNRNPNPKQLFNVPPKLTIRTSKSTFDNFEVFFGNPKS